MAMTHLFSGIALKLKFLIWRELFYPVPVSLWLCFLITIGAYLCWFALVFSQLWFHFHVPFSWIMKIIRNLLIIKRSLGSLKEKAIFINRQMTYFSFHNFQALLWIFRSTFTRMADTFIGTVNIWFAGFLSELNLEFNVSAGDPAHSL